MDSGILVDLMKICRQKTETSHTIPDQTKFVYFCNKNKSQKDKVVELSTCLP